MKRPENEEDAKKLKRIRVWDRIKTYIDEELEGNIQEVIGSIQKLHIDAFNRGWNDIKIVCEGSHDAIFYALQGTRLETDKEMRKRFAHVRRMRVRFPKKKK